MKRLGLCLVLSLIAWPRPAGASLRRAAAQSPRYAADRVVVRFRELPGGLSQRVAAAGFGILPAAVRDLLSRYRVTAFKRVFGGSPEHAASRFSRILGRQARVPDLHGWAVLEVPAGTDIQSLLSKLRQEDTLDYAGPDYKRSAFQLSPNDPFFPQQWHHHNTSLNDNGGTPGADISSTFAWPLVTGLQPVVIAILDTGISLTHPDLTANLVAGFDFVNNTGTPDDDNGHGTHVAGIAAARGNNAADVAGVMWQASLMPVKVLDAAGAGDDATIAAGIEFAATNGAQVINMSFGGLADDPLLQDAVNFASGMGVILVAAAGNFLDCAGDVLFPSDGPFFPAFYPNVISVAATDEKDQIAAYSVRAPWVKVAAPGNDILSTWPTSIAATNGCSPGSCEPSISAVPIAPNAETNFDCGTSMASPVVAGAAGLVLSRFPGLSAQDVTTHILSGVDNINAQNPSLLGQFGSGRLNVRKAVAIKPAVTSFAITPDSATIQNNSSLSFTMTISSDIAPPSVTMFLTDQAGRVLAIGNSVSFSITNQISVSGTVNIGNLSLNYPTASLVELQVGLADTVFTSTATVKTWTVASSNALPPGGSASIYNGVFNPTQGARATVRLNLSGPGHVKIRIYTMRGTLVKTLVDQDASAAGVQTFDWAGDNGAGTTVASGIYLFRIEAPGINVTQKAVVVK